MNIILISTGVGIVTFLLMLFLARNKHTRLILAIASAVWVGLTVYIFSTPVFNLEPNSFAQTPIGFTYFTSAALAFTLFINDRFNYPLIHYAALFALLLFSVAATRVLFPTDVYQSLREGISIEILAGGVSTFLIFITIDAFNDQDAEQKHQELIKKIEQLQLQIDRLVATPPLDEQLPQKKSS